MAVFKKHLVVVKTLCHHGVALRFGHGGPFLLIPYPRQAKFMAFSYFVMSLPIGRTAEVQIDTRGKKGLEIHAELEKPPPSGGGHCALLQDSHKLLLRLRLFVRQRDAFRLQHLFCFAAVNIGEIPTLMVLSKIARFFR
jgi:hypothetical protein